MTDSEPTQFRRDDDVNEWIAKLRAENDLLRGRAAHNSALQAKIVELQAALNHTSTALTAERAVTDDLADDLAADLAWYVETHPLGRGKKTLARYRKARKP